VQSDQEAYICLYFSVPSGLPVFLDFQYKLLD
jgi:hypothetical protein